MKNSIIGKLTILGLMIIGTVYLYSQHEHHQYQNSPNSGQKAEKEKILSEASIKTSAQCGQCKKRIEKAIKELKGIHHAELNVESAVLAVQYDSELITLDDVRKEVTMTGYDADSLEANPTAYKKLPKCCKKGSGHN